MNTRLTGRPDAPSPRPLRRALLPALALGAGMALAACSAGAPAPSESASGGGVLTYASGDAEPTCLDPHVGGNYPQALIASQVLEQLVSQDAAGEFQPWLASSWATAEDGLSWTFEIREDASFTDGTALDAAAVARNIAHLQDPETGSSTGYLALGKVASVETPAEHTLVLRLSEPDSALLESLSMPWLAIESPAGLDRGTEENCAAPIGTGAFIVDSWKRQDRIELVRNEDYRTAPAGSEASGPAASERLVWRFIPDSATRYAALQAGDVDIIDNAQPDSIVAAAAGESIAHLDAPRPGSVNRIELNSGSAPLNDAAVREAFVRSVNLDAGLETLFFGTAERSSSPLSSVEAFGFSEEAPFGEDLDRAAALLDGAGWSETDAEGYRVRDGQRLSLRFPVSTNQSIPAEQSLFEQLQAQAKRAGFEVRLEPLDLSTWYQRLGENEYELVSAPYTKVGPDVLRILYHSSGITPAPSGYFANHAQVNLPELDELLTRAAHTTEATERGALYDAAQRIVLEGFYILPLYDQQNHFLYRSALAGVGEVNSVGTPLLRGVAAR